MNFSRFAKTSLIVGLLICNQLFALGSLFQPTDDFSFFFSGKFRPETFYAHNYSLLNNLHSKDDQGYFSRHTIDVTLDSFYGLGTYGRNIAQMKMTMRNRAVWGDPSSITPVTSAVFDDLGANDFSHNHFIPRNIIWIREFWLSFDVGAAFGLTFKNPQTFIIGAFPFLLGRGIALGEGYAIGNSTLGFYTDFNVDQFAWGASFYGDLIKDILRYDFYTAILRNNTVSVSKNIEPVFAQAIGRKDCPERGFGSVNFLVAQRLQWNVFKNDCWGNLVLEPYAMFNHDPEQTVEFKADAESKLLTVGFAGEYEGPRWAFGFDTAMNMGRQQVRAWDRNRVIRQLRDGVVTRVNSHVYVGLDPKNPGDVASSNFDLYLAPHAKNVVSVATHEPSNVGKQADKLINSSPEGEFFNGRSIGFVDGFSTDLSYIPNNVLPALSDELFNANNRYRNGYKNKYKGWMLVTDGALFFCDKQFQLAATAGIASGDDNPNFQTIDGDYAGFIGLQEIYAGKRVRSTFILGSAGKVQVPLSIPTTDQSPSKFAQSNSGFTNLVFWGSGLHYEPKGVKRRIIFNPNMYMYWQDRPTHKFDVLKKAESDQFASTFLGTELNLFFDYYLFKDMKLFYVSSIFVPGKHFADIKGKPFNSRHAKALDACTAESIKTKGIPNIGDDVAFTLNIGLEYRF
jgi:hypothetical protein